MFFCKISFIAQSQPISANTTVILNDVTEVKIEFLTVRFQ